MKLILQMIGDKIIDKIINASDQTIHYWIKKGLMLEKVALFFNVELK